MESTTRWRGGVLAAAVLLIVGAREATPAHASAASAASAAPASAGCGFAASGTAAPATGYDEAFDNYGDTSGLWSGADSTYSTALPGDRELWSFSDTLIGNVNSDGSRPDSTPFVNNSFVVGDQRSGDQSQLSTVIGGTAGAPMSVVAPADPDAWYWSGDPTVSGNYLEVPYLEFHRTGTGAFDFAWLKNVVARFDARTLRPLGVTDLPSAGGVEWGSYTIMIDGFTYIYGVEDLGADKYAHLARVAGSDLVGAWQYFTGSGWSADESASARLLGGVSNEYSVSPLGGGYVLITQDTTELFSTHIVAYFSCSPTGPFTGKTVLYSTPETGATGTYHNGNVFTYNPHAHPELSSGNQLLISYNVNSFDINDVFADATIYRPRFIVVTFTGPGIPAHGHVDPIAQPARTGASEQGETDR